MPLLFEPLRHGFPADPAIFGGKASGLSFLEMAGVPVPSGFCLSASVEMPEDWAPLEITRFTELTESLLKKGALAIRSSAIGEDSAARSYAGLFETFLGITSVAEALDAAGRCISSGQASRVLEYGGQEKPVPVGLVVQLMVAPRVAGVCFTADPAGRDLAIVIESVPGLGDALVSGTAEPERWRVFRSGTGAWEPRCSVPKGCLARPHVLAIATEAHNLAERFGRPLDLEWAIDAGGKLWWLQARPITVFLPPQKWEISRSAPDANDGPVTLWSNWNVRETLPQPLYPLTWTVWRDVMLPMVTDLLYGISARSPMSHALNGLDLVNGRIYFNMNAMLAAPLLGPLTPHVLSVMDSRAASTLKKLVEDKTVVARRLPGSRLLLTLHMLKAGLISSLRLIKALNPRGSLARLERGAAAIASRPPVELLNGPELLDEMRLWSSPACRDLRDGMQMQAVALLVFGVSRWVFRKHPEAVGHLAMGTPANPTTRISIGIDALIDAAFPLKSVFLSSSDWPALERALSASEDGKTWILRLHSFLVEFGHRGPMEFDIGASRWREDPSMIVDLVRAGLASGERIPVSARIERLAAERHKILGRAIAASSFWHRPLMILLERLLAINMPLREAPKHYGVVVFERMRQAARELGKRLKERGILATEEDVFFLEWPELLDLASEKQPRLDLAAAIRTRRAQLVTFRNNKAPDMLRSDGVPVDEEDASEPLEGILRGTPVASGLGTGQVRILREPNPNLMKDGDILVVEYADPGWTPLFPRATALVMEIGGLMCHAALVAREMGVPAVFGVRAATSLLKDGDWVEVDGAAGTVKLIDSRSFPMPQAGSQRPSSP